MATKKQFPCMVCERRYAELEEAEVCERRHPEGTPVIRVAPFVPPPAPLACAFCNQTTDPCGCRDGRPQPLPPEELLRLGALTLQAERSLAVEQVLEDQQRVYATATREQLLQALEDRDRLLANQGRQIADQRMGSRLLREFMRAALYTAGGKPEIQAAEAAIRRLGGEEADARQLKLHGSTLGPLESPEKVAGELASGERKQR